jgi:hypothetical protein
MDGCQELEKAEYIASRRDAMCENMTGSRCSSVVGQSFVVRRSPFVIRNSPFFAGAYLSIRNERFCRQRTTDDCRRTACVSELTNR